MAKVTVKLFGVLRVDTGLDAPVIEADTVENIFAALNKEVNRVFMEKLKADPTLALPDKLSFKDALVFVNETRCKNKKTRLNDGDEIWLLSPASGG